MENFKTKLNKVKVFVFDVDGVLTDGSVVLFSDGEQGRTMNIKDGYAMQLAVKKGYRVAIISGGKSEMVRKRLNGLGIQDIYLGAHTKIETFREFTEIYDIDPQTVLYMGDDIPDYEVMKEVGVPTCPGDSAPEIKSISVYISHQPGGRGAVRDVIEQVLRLHGNWFDTEGFTW